jgi:peptidoglycan/LPS O-acetylase OafA/YrhL
MLYALCPMLYALCPMLYENMNSRREKIVTILLILLGVIIVPFLIIWSADNIFGLTLKTFIAAFFLLLLIRIVPRKKPDPRPVESRDENDES